MTSQSPNTTYRMTLKLRNPTPGKINRRTYTELADASGVPRATLYRQMTGRCPLTAQTIGRLCGAFSLDITELVELVPELVAVRPTSATRTTGNNPDEATSPTEALPHEIHQNQPWLVIRAGTYPKPELPNLPRHSTPAEIAEWEANEVRGAWANYRRLAQQGEHIHAVAELGPFLKRKVNPVEVVAHLNAHGPFDPTNSIEKFLKNH